MVEYGKRLPLKTTVMPPDTAACGVFQDNLPEGFMNSV